MDEETYWTELLESVEQVEYDHVEEHSKRSYIFSLNIIRNNKSGGRKQTEY